MHLPRSLLAAPVALVLAATLAAPASATYPGDPGDIAFGAAVGTAPPDVYAARPDGTELRRLTENPGFDACPAYDARGERIAYCSGMPTEPGVVEIWTMRADGTHERQVTDLDGFAIFPDFAPKGHRLAFSWREAVPPGTPLPKLDIWTVRDDGRKARPLTRTPDHDDAYPAYSPDGRWIAFMRFANPDRSDSEMWLMDKRGRHQRQLTSDDLPKDQLPDWRPDGRLIAYEAARDIWVVRPDGTGRRNLTRTPLVHEYGPTWSPDGRRIAYLEFRERRVYTMRADGSDVRPLTAAFAPQFVPAWQPLPDRHG